MLDNFPSILFHLFSLRDLKNHNIEWFNAIMVNVNDEMKTWSEALIFAQESFVIEEVDDLDDNISIKRDAKVRFVYIPPSDQLQVLKPFPNRDDDVGKFREVSGTVVRMSNVKLIEMKREFFCPDCKNKIELDAEPSLKYKFDVPGKCPTEKCNGKLQKKNGDPIKEHSRNYQEIIIQVRHLILSIMCNIAGHCFFFSHNRKYLIRKLFRRA